MTTKAELTIHQCECDICEAGTDPEIAQHHHQMNLFLSRLNEPQRRWYVGLLSQKPGSPSDRQLSLITGLDEKTIRRGRRELDHIHGSVPCDLTVLEIWLPARIRQTEGSGRVAGA